jgi:hypothetical protein
MPLTLIARILAATAALSGTTRGDTAANTGLGRSSFGGAGVAVAEMVLEGAGVLAGLAGAVDALAPGCAPRTYRSRGSTATAPAITVITRPIVATAARTTIAICLGPKGSAHLLPLGSNWRTVTDMHSRRSQSQS